MAVFAKERNYVYILPQSVFNQDRIDQSNARFWVIGPEGRWGHDNSINKELL